MTTNMSPMVSLLNDWRFLETQPKEVLGTMKVPNLDSELGNLTCPILGFWGHNDEFCPASGAQKFLNACSQTRFTIVTGMWTLGDGGAR